MYEYCTSLLGAVRLILQPEVKIFVTAGHIFRFSLSSRQTRTRHVGRPVRFPVLRTLALAIYGRLQLGDNGRRQRQRRRRPSLLPTEYVLSEPATGLIEAAPSMLVASVTEIQEVCGGAATSRHFMSTVWPRGSHQTDVEEKKEPLSNYYVQQKIMSVFELIIRATVLK